ncbi:hypothetical protein POVWA2_000500 [Plasmodium ovale wallikeri]|uniref:Uncharacterized protein n=1 Tax=Plasmodium ovale wallikeri TaxID=864142 RepID=A0A1A8YFP4_PLAOA|nr:hypothetical protein POVWA1_000230 [Plasmodium ovale wallikeri]SBT30742.1 hypothetical protein POVWA2_000500 [Plasmodium ovale wallikeri]
MNREDSFSALAKQFARRFPEKTTAYHTITYEYSCACTYFTLPTSQRALIPHPFVQHYFVCNFAPLNKLYCTQMHSNFSQNEKFERRKKFTLEKTFQSLCSNSNCLYTHVYAELAYQLDFFFFFFFSRLTPLRSNLRGETTSTGWSVHFAKKEKLPAPHWCPIHITTIRVTTV